MVNELLMPNEPVHLLLVEDNNIDAELLMRAVQRKKILNPITRVTNGEVALEALRGECGLERVPRPYIILLDIHMPRMSGLEFLEAIGADQELCNSVVYLLVSGDGNEERYVEYDAQLAGYIQKEKLVPTVIALLMDGV
jgi:CheY-like chemotaxis protein